MATSPLSFATIHGAPAAAGRDFAPVQSGLLMMFQALAPANSFLYESDRRVYLGLRALTAPT
jgi:hypothetical protein